MNETLSRQLPEVKAKIEEMVRASFPQVRFTDIWVRPGISPWFGDAVVHIWAIYDGEVDDLFKSPDKPSFGSRVQDMLWDRDLDVLPKLHFITKADAGDWRPEGI